MFPASKSPTDDDQQTQGKPAHLFVFLAWGAVAVFFGRLEHLRKQALQEAIVQMTDHVDARTNPELLTDLNAVLAAAGDPDWTMLSILALVIALRSFYRFVGEVRLTRANAHIVSALRKL
ncbi:hypothetical protein JANAI62_32830 [Jannaschia pagri]|uniref:Uncharacterized protein n=1 Tax=Jannaschia pagri TaxID=2829797 RepID=A0ABQ4NQV4_9RHOB|nr:MULTISPECIES: hypothetical protein [unclassified Jannaschia]GIT92825.1 hypothetical protein JANAI61_32830 [Jannaschia sp. AI_61]GIT96660.1 hypothetical protein JANAI62_32830 [Jannaschia sp. AI_62]